MRAVIQRVSRASVEIENKIVAKINIGLLIFIGIEVADDKEDSVWLANKIVNLRIFNDDNGIMNKSVKEIDGDLQVVSQFTLHALTKKGNRPSYIHAAKGEFAEINYNLFVDQINMIFNKKIKTGKFGADMQIDFENDGPVTIIIDSKNKV